MNSLGSSYRQFSFYLGRPEMRIFWLLLPFIAAVTGLNLFFLEPPFSFVSGGLLLFVGAAVFWATYRLARTNLETTIERNELQNIVSAIDDAILVYDQNFRVLFFNPAAEKLFGRKSAEIVNQEIRPQDVEKSATRLLAQVVFPSLAPSIVARTRAGQYPQVSDLSFADPGLELRVTTTPISDRDGKLIGFMKLIRNRTRETELLRSKEEFITLASHQLRTPVTELNWALQSLAQAEGMPPASAEIFARAQASSAHLLNLVEDLLNVSKIEEGRFGYTLQELDLVPFLEKALGDLLPQAERAGLKLYFDRPKEPLPKVMADPAKLQMVVANLLDNAIRYNVPNGQIIAAVRPAADGPFAEVSVKDTGIGVPSDEVPKLFSKFFRGSNALKFQTEGSGLGLYLAKNILAAHGGRIWAESELGRGTTVTFSLPTDPTLVPQKEVALE